MRINTKWISVAFVVGFAGLGSAVALSVGATGLACIRSSKPSTSPPKRTLPPAPPPTEPQAEPPTEPLTELPTEPPTEPNERNGEYTSVVSGGPKTCAVTSTGGLVCWGDAGLYDSVATSCVPEWVPGFTSGIRAVVSSRPPCALTSAGALRCWRRSRDAWIAIKPSDFHESPTPLSGFTSRVLAVATSLNHTCALTSVGAVMCWGYNCDGQIGDNTIDSCAEDEINPIRLWPTLVRGLTSGVSAIAAGADHTCAITSSGGVLCWGSNWSGQLGDNTRGTDRPVPTGVTGLASGVTAIAAGGSHTCAVTSSGGVLCWGGNSSGQLGDGSDTDKLVPTQVTGLTSGVQAITAGNGHTCALTSAGGVLCWGRNSYGQLGDNSDTNKFFPTQVTGLTSGVRAISADLYNTCALTSSGAIMCWGANSSCQIGDGTRSSAKRVPTRVAGVPESTESPR